MIDNISCAIDACISSNYIYLDHNYNQKDFINKTTPFDIVSKKEAFDNLSNEAKEIIDIIFNSSQEVINTIKCDFYKEEQISLTKLHKYIKKVKNWTHPKINNAFNEIKGIIT